MRQVLQDGVHGPLEYGGCGGYPIRQPSELVKSLMRVDGYQLLGILFQRHLLISLS